METTFEKIIRKTRMKPISCKCNLCKKQCAHPCLGTPEDMVKIIEAGFKDYLTHDEIEGKKFLRPKRDELNDCCVFFENRLCKLHDLGLKPTVGKLSHH